MNEETSTPYVDWEYELITIDGAWESARGSKSTRDNYPPPGSGWHIEFRGRTLGDEMLLANYNPSDDEDAGEWLSAFGSESSPPLPVSIDTYFGPQSAPEEDLGEPDDDSAHPGADLVDVEHTIYIGHGWAKQHKTEVTITIPPEVFRDAAVSLLRGFKSQNADIDQRIFRLFTHIDAASYERFLSTVEEIQSFAPPDAARLIDHPREPTFSHVPLLEDEVISIFRRQDGVISHQQLYRELRTTSRALKGCLQKAGLVEAGKRDLTRWLFRSHHLLKEFVPWLRDNTPTYGTAIFIRRLIEAKCIKR